LTRAVALDPRNCEAHNYLGITLSEKGWGTSAEQEIRKAVDLCPDYGDAHFNLAVLYLRQKTPRIEMARYHYMKALDLGAESDPQIDAQLKRTPPKASTLRGPTPSVATEAAPATETPPAQ
jgi:Flp pilus assembly protein TadD